MSGLLMSDVERWLIVADDEDADLHHTECPRCKKRDTIVEQDHAIRWNRLTCLTPTGAVASTGDDGDWDFDQWYCTGCGADDLDAPEGFGITDWY